MEPGIENGLRFLLAFGIYVIAMLAPVAGALYVLYFLLTLPLRRKERARLFLHVLELGLKNGRTPEETLRSASASHDRSLGVRFHLLAEYLASGMRLSQALERVPRLLPPQVTGLLAAGERIGDLRKVLPACRQSLGGAVSQTRGAHNYLVLILFGFTPLALVTPLFIGMSILPKYQEVYVGMMEGSALPAFTRLVFAGGQWFTAIQVGIICFLWLGMLAYVGGPRLSGWLSRVLPGDFPGLLAFCLPWKRARLQRDFSSILALLLDAGLPEAEALELAGVFTGSTIMSWRARVAAERLRQGSKLTEAVRGIGPDGELQWRLSNAAHQRGGFFQALSGWHESLEAKAFQMEQGVAQVTTTALLLLNGLIVGSIVIGLFLPLINLISVVTL